MEMQIETNVRYDIDLDHSMWVPVPIRFPWEGINSAHEWADGLAKHYAKSYGFGPQEVSDFREDAQARSEGFPRESEIERFWHHPLDDGFDIVVHLEVATVQANSFDEITQFATFGMPGTPHIIEELFGTPFDAAYKSVTVTPLVTSSLIALRFIGLYHQHLFCLSHLNGDPRIIAAVDEHVESILRSFRLGVD